MRPFQQIGHAADHDLPVSATGACLLTKKRAASFTSTITIVAC